jgi:3-oxoadipate enol-lactonase
LCAGLSGSEALVLIEGAAHAANLTHANAVNPPLLKFLRQLASA